jgi:hypothetical protein
MAESGVRSKEVASAALMGEKYTGGSIFRSPLFIRR